MSIAATVGWGEMQKAERNTEVSISSTLLENFKPGLAFSEGDI